MQRFRYFCIIFTIIIMITGCAGMNQRQSYDPSKETNLSKYPIGLHVHKIGVDASGMTHVDLTVRNNSGNFINMLYVEVYPYNGENRVGMQNHIFNSVNVGETMIERKQIITGGRQWDGFKSSYRIQ
jgi:hypothetical protein